MPIDYSKWKDIEISDDEDDTHPNVDTPSLYRWRHQARLERMEQQKREKEEVLTKQTEAQRRMNEIRSQLAKADAQDNREKLQVELSVLEKQEEDWRQKEAELEKKEKLSAWNVDTIAHDGFSKSRVNKAEKPQPPQLTEEQKEENMRKFVRDNEKLIKKFSLLNKYDDAKTFLLEHPHLCCEETANWLVIECLNHQMMEKESLMEHVAHQTIVMQYLLELAKSLDIAPYAPQLISSFFAKMKMAEKQYLDAFEDELNQFKERIRRRAAEKIAEAEEEERKKRLGPGGLDPIEVMESLPESLQKCFESKDIRMLQEVMAKMPKEEAAYHLKRCVDSGLWVPDAKTAAAGANEEEEETEEFHDAAEPETELRQRKPAEKSADTVD